MLLTDEETIQKLDIKASDRVLDIGGSMRQRELIQVDTLVDLIPPKSAPYGKTKLLAKKFIQLDVTREKLPFGDKEFDVVLCTHTLEDLPTPFPILDEMQRVGKRGIIVTPSMGFDMTFTPINFTDWLTGARRVPGEAHHKWLFVKNENKLKVIPKNYPILYSSDFQITKWLGEKEMVYVWKSKIDYEEFFSLNIHNLIDEYENFKRKNSKFIKKSKVLMYFDSPYNVLKAWAKRLTKRGVGYKYRKLL